MRFYFQHLLRVHDLQADHLREYASKVVSAKRNNEIMTRRRSILVIDSNLTSVAELSTKYATSQLGCATM